MRRAGKDSVQDVRKVEAEVKKQQAARMEREKQARARRRASDLSPFLMLSKPLAGRNHGIEESS